MKHLRITIEGKTYDVTVELANKTAASTEMQAAAVVAAASVSAPAAPGVIPSPLGGNVIAVNVKVGDTVKAGDQVAVLEAMKMNTYINAPAAGKVAEISVKVGEAIQEGQAIMRIE